MQEPFNCELSQERYIRYLELSLLAQQELKQAFRFEVQFLNNKIELEQARNADLKSELAKAVKNEYSRPV